MDEKVSLKLNDMFTQDWLRQKELELKFLLIGNFFKFQQLRLQYVSKKYLVWR